ncbi:MAG TPA: S8 family serine peptidase [Solirubrobacterales bacterium]|nr:S8 family serine peptidase [Solirubrobacterales bacterium]
MTVAAKPDELQALSAVPRVAGAREALQPIAYSTCPSGAVVSEGVQQLHAGDASGEARQAFGVDGSGVTVGILSDSFNRATEAADGSGPVATTASQDVSSGDLPGLGNTCLGETTPVGVLDDTETEGEDEGRAMAQIVHDVAPGANLAFATAFAGLGAFVANIEKLAKPVVNGGAGAKVIADDVSYSGEPFFQEGPVAAAVRKVTEDDGVTYLSAAGNENLFDASGNEIASWEAQQFRDAGGCPVEIESLAEVNGTHCMDFDPGPQVDRTFGIKVAPHETVTIDLQWAEPWYGVETDLDAFLLNALGEPIADSTEDNVNLSKIPFEFVQWENESSSSATVQLVVNRFSGSLPRLKFELIQGGVTATEYPRSSGTDVVGPTVFGHSGSVDAISVGAVRYNNDLAAEPFSSRGPVVHYFGPVNGTSPAPKLGTPQVLAKPDVVATDCGVTSFFASWTGLAWRFCGTSAATPHAAGVGALMLDAQGSASPQAVREALLDGAAPLTSIEEPCATGAGLVDAVKAIEALETPAPPIEPECDVPGPEVSVEEARAAGNWGLETPPAEPAAPQSPKPSPPQSTPAPSPAAAPTTRFRKRPPKVTLTRRRSVRLVFRFESDQPAVTFLCKVDRQRFHRCAARFVRRYPLGRHVLRVKARRDSDGATDATPAVYRFRVRRVRHGLIERRSRHHRG